jgi:hypothetical protein
MFVDRALQQTQIYGAHACPEPSAVISLPASKSPSLRRGVFLLGHEERELLGKLLRGTIDNASMPKYTISTAERLLAKLNSDAAEQAIRSKAPPSSNG